MPALARRLALAAVVVAVTTPVAAADAALRCGAAKQPTCTEDPAPDVELVVAKGENPARLKPLNLRLGQHRALWKRVRGHKPFGFNATSAGRGGVTVADEVALHRGAGATLARLTVDWAVVQRFPNREAGGPSWHYAPWDEAYRAYVAAGVRPLLTILRTPRRFTRHAGRPAGERVPGCGWSDLCFTPPRPDAMAPLATFARDLARRYPLAAGIEVWNEPNLSAPFWGGDRPDPAHYTRMLRTVSEAVHAVRPRLPVLGGALANYVVSSTDAAGTTRVAMRAYLAEMLRQGAGPAMDAVSLHPYLGAYPASAPDIAGVLRQRLRASGDELTGAYADAGVAMEDRVVVTEFGLSTTSGWPTDQQSAWLQAQYTAYDRNDPEAPLSWRTDGAFVHALVDDPSADAPSQVGFGLVSTKQSDGSFRPKPAYCALRQTYGRYADCPAALRAGP